MRIMLDRRPFLFHAHYDWICDSACRVYVKVDCTHPDAFAPMDCLDENGILRMDISRDAVRKIVVEESGVTVEKQMNGRHEKLYLPFDAMEHMYCPDTGVIVELKSDSPIPNKPARKDDMAPTYGINSVQRRSGRPFLRPVN